MNRTERFTTRTGSHDSTAALGAALGARIDRGMCVVLVGVLGAGKTTMVGGLCRGLGVEEPVQSPTFILYEAFAGRRNVVHIDLYRLEHESKIEDLGVFDLVGTDTVVLAEWGDRSAALLDAAEMVIEIAHDGTDVRTVTVTCSEELADTLGGVTQWS